MKTDSKGLKDRLREMYEVSNVAVSYDYWFSRLLSFTLQMFEWKGLPESLSAREIELQLQLTGHCVIYMNGGKPKTTFTTVYGFDAYYQPTDFTYAQPIQGSYNGKIESNTSAIIYNSILQDNLDGVHVDGGLYSFIAHYARMLADVTSTTNIYAVNMRITDYPIAKNDAVKQSLEKFFNMFRLGKHAIISSDSEILKTFESNDRGRTRTSDTLVNIIDAKERILESFFRDIGVKFRQTKRAQMTDEEIESDEQLLLINPQNLLAQRQKDLVRVNKVFGTDISVKLSANFNRENFASTQKTELERGAENE